MKKKEDKCFSLCASRRQFLMTSGAATATVLLSGVKGVGAGKVEAAVSKYPRKKIGSLRKLRANKPQIFNYPDKGKFSTSMLVKLGTEAGGGVGPSRDVVAFNTFCTHQGGNMKDNYQASDKAMGPCEYHLTTFDLTRHGMVISGHGTESLSQITLEVEGDAIYATGMVGLIYGRNSNV